MDNELRSAVSEIKFTKDGIDTDYHPKLVDKIKEEGGKLEREAQKSLDERVAEAEKRQDQRDFGRVDGDAQKELGKEIEKDISGGMGMGM